MKRWNKTRKLPAVLLAVLLALSVLAGCSDAASSDSSVNDRSQTASASGSEVQDASDNEEQDGEPAVSESDDGSSEPVDVRIAALKGPTAMGMVKFMNDVDQQTITDENYTFSIVASPDEVTPQIAQGNLDIAAVPANLASILYNNTDGAVQVLTVNTLGVLYIVENGGSSGSLYNFAHRSDII